MKANSLPLAVLYDRQPDQKLDSGVYFFCAMPNRRQRMNS
jgi:hypothetical protein